MSEQTRNDNEHHRTAAPATFNNWERETLERLVFATVREQRASRRWSIFFKLTFLLLGFFALIAALYQYRAQVVAAAPEARGVYETLGIAVGGRNLEFRNVDFRWADPETRTRLEVWGEVVNVGKSSQTIPLIRFSMRDGEGLELYARTLSLQQRHLAPGASNSFSIALESPPKGAVDITVDFVAPET